MFESTSQSIREEDYGKTFKRRQKEVYLFEFESLFSNNEFLISFDKYLKKINEFELIYKWYESQ
jgi:hypothetical protein